MNGLKGFRLKLLRANNDKPLHYGLLLATGVLVLDQLSKWWVLTDIMNPPRVIEVTSFFNLVLAWNRGISFGMFSDGADWGGWALTGVAVIITGFLVRWLAKAETTLTQLALGLVIGGAIGNVIDRVRFGAVIDFLDFHAMGFHWPAFNVADSAIVVGGCCPDRGILVCGARNAYK